MVERWSWLGDPLAIDVANTVRRRGWRYVELIRSPDDLAGWLARERHRLVAVPEVDPTVVGRFVQARDHVIAVLRAAATGRPLAETDADALNDLVRSAPTMRLLVAGAGAVEVRPVRRRDPTSLLLGQLAGATIDLVSSAERERLALCDAPGCGQLYLRTRPNQVWCNPHCGNRARGQRHADRLA